MAQILRLVQRMIDKYNNFYKERTPSRERARYDEAKDQNINSISRIINEDLSQNKKAFQN